jgi:periplasmic protein TonB
MFEQSILRNSNGRKKWTIGLAILAEMAVVGMLVLIPLMYVQAIPTPELMTELTLPPPPPPPPPPAPAAAKIQRTAPRRFNPGELTAPPTVPKQPPLIAETSEPSLPTASDLAAVPGGLPGGVAGGVIGGIVGAVPSPAPPPPPPAEKPAPAPVQRIKVGGAVQAAKLVHEVQPVFPKLAAEARIGGVVRLKAVIAKDGHIKDLALISGHPLLVPAAMKAVTQWVYRPTYLNGQPAEVDTEIDVTFALST